MPRFFFDVHDGADYPDDIGQELSGIDAARREAAIYAGQLLAEIDRDFWNGREWYMRVKNERGLILFTLHFLAIDAPSIPPPS